MCSVADESLPELYANSDDSHDESIPGIHVITIDTERSPHQFQVDYTSEGENLPSNTNEAYDYFEAHQEILKPIFAGTVVYLVYEGAETVVATTWSSLDDDRDQLENAKRDDVREVRCLGRHWRSGSAITCWPSLIGSVGIWALISVTTDAMAAEIQDPIRYGTILRHLNLYTYVSIYIQYTTCDVQYIEYVSSILTCILIMRQTYRCGRHDG